MVKIRILNPQRRLLELKGNIFQGNDNPFFNVKFRDQFILIRVKPGDGAGLIFLQNPDVRKVFGVMKIDRSRAHEHGKQPCNKKKKEAHENLFLQGPGFSGSLSLLFYFFMKIDRSASVRLFFHS